MSKCSLMPVKFHGTSLSLINKDEKAFVALKPICEALCIQWEAQLKRIRRNPVLSQGVSIMDIPSNGGSQEMICLPLSMLNGWLFGINANRVKNPEIRQKLIEYQFECYDVLNAYWMGKPIRRVAVPEPAPVAPIPLPVPRFVVVNFYGATLYLAPFQDRIYTTLEHICHGIGLNWGEQHERTLLDRVVRRWIRVIHMSTENGKAYGGICLPLSALNDWLFGIDADRVASPYAREKLAVYKRECCSALSSFWSGQLAKPLLEKAAEHVLLPAPEPGYTARPVFRFPFDQYTIRGIQRDGCLWFVEEDLRIVFDYNASRGLTSKGVATTNISTACINNKLERVINADGLFQIVSKRHRPGRSPGRMRRWVSQVVMPMVLAGIVGAKT